jgi:hypothetical protein
MDLEQHLKRQMAFSKATFGPGDRMEGVTDHIRQELNEVGEYNDPREWVDLVLLSLDGLWRSIHYRSPDENARQYFLFFNHRIGSMERVPRTWENVAEIASRLIEEKQAKNEQRDWPDWRTADPTKAINHDRSKD